MDAIHLVPSLSYNREGLLYYDKTGKANEIIQVMPRNSLPQCKSRRSICRHSLEHSVALQFEWKQVTLYIFIIHSAVQFSNYSHHTFPASSSSHMHTHLSSLTHLSQPKINSVTTVHSKFFQITLEPLVLDCEFDLDCARIILGDEFCYGNVMFFNCSETSSHTVNKSFIHTFIL